MSIIEDVRKKVQRIITDTMGRVEIDRDGDFVLHHESAVVFIRLRPMNDKPDANIVINAFSPMVVNVPITPDVYKWVATEGQYYHFGHCKMFLNDDNEKLGRILFGHSIVGNDLDPNELQNLIYSTMVVANELDNMLKDKFGGKLFSER
jgi:hypothetical protein